MRERFTEAAEDLWALRNAIPRNCAARPEGRGYRSQEYVPRRGVLRVTMRRMEKSVMSDIEPDLLPTPSDIESYDQHGFWISPVIIPGAVLDAAERGMERFYAGERDAQLAVDVGGWEPSKGDVLRKNDYSSLRVAELRRLVTYPMIAATAAALAGVDEIRLWHDQLLYKPPEDKAKAANVGWHTDRQYWMSCTSEKMLTAWVGFHDVDVECGAVCFMEGSNHWAVEALDFWDQDLDGLQRRVEEQGYSVHIHQTRMKRGQVSFHNCRTVHGSGPNFSSAPRRSLAIHLQPGTNRWRAGSSHANDRLVRQVDGHPDYTDPDICPTLWPVAAAVS